MGDGMLVLGLDPAGLLRIDDQTEEKVPQAGDVDGAPSVEAAQVKVELWSCGLRARRCEPSQLCRLSTPLPPDPASRASSPSLAPPWS